MRVLLVAAAALVLAAPAAAIRPDPYPGTRHRIRWVPYTYRTTGTFWVDGRAYTVPVVCRVNRRGRETCRVLIRW